MCAHLCPLPKAQETYSSTDTPQPINLFCVYLVFESITRIRNIPETIGFCTAPRERAASRISVSECGA